jgi:hypothetical protein
MKFGLSDKEITFNVSRAIMNYTQRNNEYSWTHKSGKLKMNALSMCNVTSMAMALDYADYQFPPGQYKQPEDNLCKFIMENKDVLDYYKKKMPVMYDFFEKGDAEGICPVEVHIVLAYGTNKWLGTSSSVTFREDIKISELLSEIIVKSKPVVMSGTFPYKNASGSQGTIGHINVLVGVKYTLEQLEKAKISKNNPAQLEQLMGILPSKWIFDDPYGSMHQNFTAGTGNDVEVTTEDFIRYYKPLNSVNVKMGHIISPGAALV